jgi:hypothetical protein
VPATGVFRSRARYVAPVRRYRLDRLPPGEPGPETVIRQVFWRLGDGWTLRLRREGPPDTAPTDTLAVRHGTGSWEFALAPEPAAGLFRTGHRTVATRRAYGPWIVHAYHWENEGLVLAGGTSAPPGGTDVTDDPAYDEENLAFSPRPSR